ncbi:MAG TPA: zinc-binding dehydrogenase, partial [Chloroflexota bacterium]|nr:zinc-binding dehydrogenase [Chloroflexota bacterium]
MRAAVVRGQGQLTLESVPEPTIGEYDALVEILACGVCTGTDTHILAGAFPYLAPYPFILGHESIGRVVARGPKVRYLHPGDLVLRPVAVRPGETLGPYGSVFGGFAEFGVVTDAQALIEDTPCGQTPKLPPFATAQQVVPSDFDPIDAGMFITFKETLSWLHHLGPLFGRSLLVLGTGPVGLCFVRIAKYLGADPVLVVGRRDERLEIAVRLGADHGINTVRQATVATVRELTAGKGVDYLVEAIGDAELLAEAMGAVADQGNIAIYGVPPKLETTLRWTGMPSTWQLGFIRPREADAHALALDLLRL